MNGVSNMLPLVISGGILMAIVFLFGANSFNPKAQSTMRLQSSFGTLVVKCIRANHSNFIWIHCT